MKKRLLVDKENGIVIAGEFDKEFKNDKYELLFNTKSGFEVLNGINGNPDPFVTDMPTLMDIGVMGHCNNKCFFCYQGDKQEPNMSLDNFKYLIDNTKHHVSQVALGGRGNPEDHEQFEEIVKFARENNVVPNYTTAGNNVDDKVVGITKDFVGATAISMYGQDMTYKALKMFMDAGVKTNIHYIWTSYNHESIIELLNGKDIWNGKVNLDKLNAIVFLLFKPKGRGKGLSDYVPNEDQVKELSELINKNQLPFKLGFDSCAINKVRKHASFTKVQEISIDTCESGRMSTYVTPDMKLVPCSFADHDKYGVPILPDGIEKAWKDSDPFNWFRNILRNKRDCCPAIL